MKPDNILKADILDIIFENKNKQYGAYPMRKFYHERLFRALGIVFLATIILMLLGYYYKSKTDANIFEIPDPIGATLYEMPKDVPKPPETSHPPQKKAIAIPSNNDNVPVITNHNTSIDALHDNEVKVDDSGDEGNDRPPGDGSPEQVIQNPHQPLLLSPIKYQIDQYLLLLKFYQFTPGELKHSGSFLEGILLHQKTWIPRKLFL